ncbi:MAG: polyphosphate polymerase domain-containing protein [Deltaproteobacteria bacterium]|nr:polyphosphate polymerase domain-containing protein [Kofleriaceae bacterium]
MPSSLADVATLFPAASTELRERRELLRRVDTKFVCTRPVALEVVKRLLGHYAALPTPGGNLATYRSLYFDTSDLRCYHDHRRGRRLRHKVRIRHYPDRGLSYLEVKTKRNEAITDKRRRPLAFHDETLGDDERTFLAGIVDLPVHDLVPMMRIDFRRLSLVALHSAERVTIDCDLAAETLDGARWDAGDRVIVEVKQSPFCLRTPVMSALLAHGLRERSMSKYTIATALVRPELRRNRLLPELKAIERMTA